MGATIYGIRNCDTMKKAFAWLDAHGVAYSFHDYRKAGVPRELLAKWCDKLGWRALVNTRGTTWRGLGPTEQAIDGDAAAIALMLAHPSVIRRPVVETASADILVGFDAARFEAVFGISGEST